MADFIEYRKSIQKLVQEEKSASLIDLLQVLMEQKITPNDLKESQIGIAVGKLRKHTDAKVKRHLKQHFSIPFLDTLKEEVMTGAYYIV